MPNCQDCGTPLKDPRSTRCKPCSNTFTSIARGRTIDPQKFSIDTDECIEWPHAMRGNYGIKNTGKTSMQAHRWVYQELVGPIPPGLDLDHTCRNTRCVNVRHLEPVTPGENKRRAWEHAERPAACPSGHSMLDPENVYITKQGWRSCRECKREQNRKWRARQKLSGE